MSYCRHIANGAYMVATGGKLECLGCRLHGGFTHRVFRSARRALSHLNKHLSEGCKVGKAIKRLETEIANGVWDESASARLARPSMP